MPTSRTAAVESSPSTDGVTIGRRFTEAGKHPFDAVEWEIRDAVIGDPQDPAFEQRGVEFPKAWSQNATNIVAQKYFRGRLGSDEREHSVKQMIGRVAGTIAGWGRELGYFSTAEDGDAFEAELTHILLHQIAAFNSPVWFNVGFEDSPQCSACFILSVEDTMESILDWNTKEGKIFRGGSGLGHQPVQHPRLDGAPVQGRHRQRPGLLHARRRLVGRHDQVRRQDAAGGQDGGAGHRPPGRPRLHLVQGARGGEGGRPARRRLRHVDRRRGLHLDPVPERQQLGARVRRVHAARRARRGVADARARRRRAGGHPQGRRGAGADRRRGVALRRSGHAVRHHDQRVAHVPELGADQRVQPVLGVHARGRLGLQPRVAQPHEVPPRRRHLRHRRVRARGRRDDPRAGDRGRSVELPHGGHRRQRPRVPPAGPGLREPGRPAHVQRAALRLRRGPRAWPAPSPR